MICAVARSGVGVDVETHSPAVDPEKIGQFMFPSAVLTELDEQKRDSEFLRLWTRTEAIGKLDGYGLCGAPSQDTDICIEYFEPAHGYVGAVAQRKQQIQLRRWQWSFA
jgi:phosphopantetheinyl transferase